MEYIKAYIILYKSNTRVIYFCYKSNHTFILTGCRVSVYTQFLCIQYMMLVFLNEMVKLSWNDSRKFMSSCSEMQRPKITASLCVLQYLCSKQNRVSTIRTRAKQFWKNNLIAIFFFYQYCDYDLICNFLKLFIFFIIQQRQAINHCIVCSIGHVTLKK